MKNQNVIEGLFTYRLHVLKKQTDRTMNEAFTDEIALTLTEARVLLSVGSFGTLSVSDLGKASNLDRSQASRATDILERKGLVEKTSSTTDGRGVVVTLTAKGKKTYTRAAAIAKGPLNSPAMRATLSSNKSSFATGSTPMNSKS